MLYAHYSNGRKGTHELRISRDIEAREVVHFVTVTGKRDARKLAEACNAKPWNF